ncbi:MAG TPA: hypothetical protein VGN25_08440 [Solirubrobacteraceae bacterium]|nr:hypothetical protein [Solirubrobacteraceae bacterium]
MSYLIAILILVLLAAVVFVVSAPLRSAGAGEGQTGGDGAGGESSHLADVIEHDELEAAREAKYREIRDAELDFRTGKLSQEDYAAIDSQLRAEALEILDRLEPDDPGESAGS